MAATDEIDKITVSLSIANIYPDEIITTTADETVPAPEAFDDETLEEWAADELLEFTGTGRTEGDSSYEITIVASTEAQLVGRTFEFG